MKKAFSVLSLSLALTFTTLPAMAAQNTANMPPDTLFKRTWDKAFFMPVPAGAQYQAFKAEGDEMPGFQAGHVGVDVNYEILTRNSDPEVPVIEPGSWGSRGSGTKMMGRIHAPAGWILPDATADETPNNPTVIVNADDGRAVFLNGTARPYPNGPVFGYIASGKPATHGGSGMVGGEISAAELRHGTINHALALNVWGKKYLNRAGGGHVYPAVKADAGYKEAGGGDYYGGDIDGLTMGTRLALPPTVTAKSLNVTSPVGLTVFQALQRFGVYIVDNTAWDSIDINATQDAVPLMMDANKGEFARMCNALQIVR